jgi:hypothetical protein
MNPLVYFIDKNYEKGVKVSNEKLREIEKHIHRNPNLRNWNFLVNF